ncbi:MAG: hypothetical protein H6662_03770 [Ardenticatenaceae bacterium]|nr:hypothetical protein [Anaerolineales bacterium]MCB8920681.1 hypothetical protein [Ardenticatenaceae bacterium]MCB8989641.1 hypothetical protein [Ardenticatenaceae bacterium]MCB9002901.1 hypothetical protein [Ardenticatenaceae bacterium]
MSRLEWVLGILLVVLLLMVLGLSAVLWFRPDEPELPEGLPPTAVSQPIATSVYQEKTAKVGYASAQRGVQDWYDDAVLLDATATWPEGVTETTLRAGEANWAYTFYSAANSAVTLVTVRGDEASRISESPYVVSDSVADVESWNVDSQEAVDLFLNEGGAQFLRDEGPSAMVMKLTTTNGRMEWFLSLFANRNGRSYSMFIDATSGAVVAVEEVP